MATASQTSTGWINVFYYRRASQDAPLVTIVDRQMLLFNCGQYREEKVRASKASGGGWSFGLSNRNYCLANMVAAAVFQEQI